MFFIMKAYFLYFFRFFFFYNRCPHQWGNKGTQFTKRCIENIKTLCRTRDLRLGIRSSGRYFRRILFLFIYTLILLALTGWYYFLNCYHKLLLYSLIFTTNSYKISRHHGLKLFQDYYGSFPSIIDFLLIILFFCGSNFLNFHFPVTKNRAFYFYCRINRVLTPHIADHYVEIESVDGYYYFISSPTCWMNVH